MSGIKVIAVGAGEGEAGFEPFKRGDKLPPGTRVVYGSPGENLCKGTVTGRSASGAVSVTPDPVQHATEVVWPADVYYRKLPPREDYVEPPPRGGQTLAGYDIVTLHTVAWNLGRGNKYLPAHVRQTLYGMCLAAYEAEGEVEGKESPKERAKDAVDTYLGGAWKDCGAYYLAVEDE